jgi:hypothetical protein
MSHPIPKIDPDPQSTVYPYIRFKRVLRGLGDVNAIVGASGCASIRSFNGEPHPYSIRLGGEGFFRSYRRLKMSGRHSYIEGEYLSELWGISNMMLLPLFKRCYHCGSL